ncbi:FadR/GntR family transcriptional regulator [Pseudoflavitalea sp. G-6-1-2]|uniref:FadR/GntR family transcriptional regulator n=1 Tax=Pseudoflavitalea sp. G-6-1-2 TaxID=2728841 RepID=UPI001F0CF13C|nr:FadR/GntR family transcriptional regulator [Pseudoflavitalea sp. G-6-1-2]
MMNRQPLKRQSLADEVAVLLEQQISQGLFKTGDQLPTEPELMESFGVGRSSIREAVKILVNKGMVKVQQGVGMFILSTEPSEPLSNRLQRAHFEDLNEVRLLLEVKIAEKAAINRTAKDVTRIKGFLKDRARYATENNKEACIQADINFHSAIADASGNPIIVDLYKTIATHLKQAFMERYKDTSGFMLSQQLHEDLLQAIADKNPARALIMATKISTHTK